MRIFLLMIIINNFYLLFLKMPLRRLIAQTFLKNDNNNRQQRMSLPVSSRHDQKVN